MKTKINLVAICFLLAGTSLIPQVAHAQLVLVPPCTAASLNTSFGYLLSGLTGKTYITGQAGSLTFNGNGGFTNTFDVVDTPNFISVTDVRGQVTQGTYTISSDCSTGTLIFHGNPAPCIFVNVAFNVPPPFNAVGLGILPLIPLGSQAPVGPLGAPVSGPSFLGTDATLSCADSDANVFPGNGLVPVMPIGQGLRGTPDGTSFGSFNFPLSLYIGFMIQE